MFLCPQPKTVELKGGYYYFEPGTEPQVTTKVTPLLSQKESYRINIEKDGVFIEGADEAGVYYGRLTLSQVMKNYNVVFWYDGTCLNASVRGVKSE